MSEIAHNTTQSAPTPAPVTAQAKSAAAAAVLADPALNQEALEKALEGILLKRQHAAIEAAKPVEPDWTKVQERDIFISEFYIPVVEHELPDYMNMKLADTSYEVVWASRDQRRIGQLMAMGYEMLKPEHIHPDFTAPLQFDSEQLYVYADVVAMRVHKRILYGRRKKALQTSLNQLSNRNRPPRVRAKNSYELMLPTSPEVGNFYDDPNL
jgi:hypothetical protein